MAEIDFIILSQAEALDHSRYRVLPLENLSLYRSLIYPRMVYYQGGFRSHLDLVNCLTAGTSWEEATFPERRNLLSIWNLPGFNGLYLANFLKPFGISSVVINNIDAEWDLFCRYYREAPRKPLVGISTTFQLSFSVAGRIAKMLRRCDPEMELVVGGAHVSSVVREKGADALAAPMQKYRFDFALYSENSETDLKELLQWRKGDRSGAPEVANLAYRSRDGEIKHTKVIGRLPLIGAAAAGAPFPLAAPTSTIQLRTSVGCPFSCRFCSYPEAAGGFHLVPEEIVEQNLRSALATPGISKIIFIDDTFNIPIRRFQRLLCMFSRYDFDWFSFLRVQYVTDEIAALLRASGCKGVYLGIESANDGILANMNKKVTRRDYARGIEALHKHGITTMAAFVLGFPGETEQTARENRNFIESMQFSFYTLKEFYYLHNTPIHKDRERYSLKGEGGRWSHATMDSVTAQDLKISLFQEIDGSVFVDPDTSLWYLAYLYDQGFSMAEIARLQGTINGIMKAQLAGDFTEKGAAYESIRDIARKRFTQ